MSKPIIRHCRNCEYSEKWCSYDHIKCEVKYKTVREGWQRFKALFCKYYKKKGRAK